jgi:hypothetical protein
MELTRRGAIRLAGATGLAAAAGAFLAAAPASPALADQNRWRWCRQCQGLWFSDNPTHGVCPRYGTNGHSLYASGNYTLNDDAAGVLAGQPGWIWCRQCQGLWYGFNGTAGACPASQFGHSATGSTIYALDVNTGSGQGNWSWCQQCQGLWFAGNSTNGACPAPGAAGGHTRAGSGNYQLDVGVG